MAQSIELKLNHKTLHISVPEGVTADPKLLDGGHPLYYILKTPNATVTYLNEVAKLHHGKMYDNVLEFCGGIGLIPLTLFGQWDQWSTVELDPSCETAYQCGDVEFCLGDMYDPKWDLSGRDLIFMDFPSNTLPKMWREEKRRALLNRVAEAKPRYWHITDVAYYWIHLANHWPIYQEVFGVKPTRQNYHELFDKYMRDNFGYKVIKWTVGGGAQYFLMEAM